MTGAPTLATRAFSVLRSRWSSVIKRGAGILLAIVLGLALLEGLASLGLFVYDLVTEARIPRHHHARHDPELGWVNEPGSRIADLYGPGLGVTINLQGFRNAVEFPREVPPAKVRVVCSGDSFTFGYGVADSRSWPALLAGLDERIEAVNMGQPGYGLDQMYLRYLRDGRRVDHHFHVFAAVVDDLWRMQGNDFLGHGKPMLKLENGRVVADAVPVPRSFLSPWLFQNARLLRRLRLAQLVDRWLPSRAAAISDVETWRVAAAAVDALAAVHREEGRSFLFVFLPTLPEYSSPRLGVQRRALLEALDRQGVPVLDLLPELRRLPPPRMKELFLEAGDVVLPHGEGHYSPEGNLFVARRIHAWMTRAGLL